MARLSTHRIDLEINKFAKAVIKRARGNLSRTGRKSSGTLWKSLGYRYTKGRLTFRMADYGAFIDQGVTGHGKGTYKPRHPRRIAQSLSGFKFKKGPVGDEAELSFASWIRGERIRPRNPQGQFVRVNESSLSSLNFLLRRSTGRFGIPPSRFFSEAYEFYAPKFEKVLDKVVGQEIEDAINDIFDRNLTRCKG